MGAMSRCLARGLIGAIACLVAGCGLTSGSTAQTPAQTETQPTAALCDRVSKATDDKNALLQEMLRRRAISDEHVAAIRARKVVVGMNSCETIAAWGPPEKYSNTPGIDYHTDPSMVSAAMVYDYGTRGRIGFNAKGLVTTVTR
jgi:hypothetical protein